MLTTGSLLALAALLAFSSYVLLLFYRITFHPLAKLPGPLANKLTGWPNHSAVLAGNRHIVMYKLHQKYGPVVRFAPNVVSINTATALKDIYGPRKVNVIKAEWYTTISTAEKVISTFTARDPAVHAIRRRMLSHAFSEKAMQDAETYVSNNVTKWLDCLGAERISDSKWTVPKNVATLISYLTFDVVTDLGYGRSFDLLNKDNLRFVAELIPGAVKGIFALGYHPFVSILRPILLQSFIGDMLAGQDVRDHARLLQTTRGFLDERRSLELDSEKSQSTSRKDFFYHLFRGKDPETGRTYTNDELAADSILLVVAGADTSSTTLAACIFYLLRNPAVLANLRADLQDNFDRIEDIIYSGTVLSTLPYLRAVIDETLRMSPPVSSHIPREVVGDGITIDQVFYPPGMIIGISVYALHHNDEYFPEPFLFKPERWIANEKTSITKESVEHAQSAFTPFMIGSRGCIGKNLAYMELSLALARCIFKYDMEEVKGWEKQLNKQIVALNGEYPIADHFVAKNDGPMVRFRER